MRDIGLAAVFASLLAILFLSASAYAQVLGGGEADFVVQPIVLGPVPYEEGQYCGNPNDPSTLDNRLALVGDPDFLNFRWIAEDPTGAERQIGVDCWLNCPAAFDPESIRYNISACSNDGIGIYQNCSYLGPTGDHGCAISNVDYVFNGNNTVVCRFFDQVKPSEGLAVPNKTFRLTDYRVNVQPIAVTVGAVTEFPISVRSFGLIDSFYMNNLSVKNSPWFVHLTNPVSNTSVAECGESVQTLPKVQFLSANNLPFTISSNSSEDRFECAVDSECHYLGADSSTEKSMCVHGNCVRQFEIEIDAQSNSLSEYNILGFIMLVTLSTLVFFFSRRKLKVF